MILAYVVLYAIAALLVTLGLLVPAIILAVAAKALAFRVELLRLMPPFRRSAPVAESG